MTTTVRPLLLTEPNNRPYCPECASSPTSIILLWLSTAVTQMTTSPPRLWKIVWPSSVSIYTATIWCISTATTRGSPPSAGGFKYSPRWYLASPPWPSPIDCHHPSSLGGDSQPATPPSYSWRWIPPTSQVLIPWVIRV